MMRLSPRRYGGFVAPIGCSNGYSLLHFDGDLYDQKLSNYWTETDASGVISTSTDQSVFGSALKFDWDLWSPRTDLPEIKTLDMQPVDLVEGIAIKFWYYSTTYYSDAHLLFSLTYTSVGYPTTVASIFVYPLAGLIQAFSDSASISVTPVPFISSGVWQYFELSFVGGNINLFVDGVLVGSVGQVVSILGADYDSAEISIKPMQHISYLVGGQSYMDEFEITRTNVHSSNYAVPTAPTHNAECPPTTPSGNVWLVYENYLGDSYIGNYDGSSYTAQAQDTGFGLVGSFVKEGTKVYQYNIPADKFFYSDTGALGTWTELTVTVPSAGGGRIVSDGTYLYLAGGVVAIQRMALPTGAFSDISGGAALAKGGGITVHNSALFMTRNGEQDVNKSTDNGATWSTVGALGTLPDTTTVWFASDGTRLCACYVQNSDAHVVIRYSDDDGATWSSVVYTFPSPYTSQIDQVGSGFLHDGTHFVAILNNGKTAYSTDGASWTAGGTIPRDMKYVSQGIGKIVASCAYTELYETTDHGATWTQMTAPTGTGAPADNTYAYWIGDNP